MTVIPISLREARAFVAAQHRHSQPPRGWLFGAALELEGELVGVGVAGRPVAHQLQDGRTIEITRVCTIGTRNAGSMMYGALCRAATALGYRRAITYNLRSESGSSLRAAGFRLVEELGDRQSWASKGRGRYDATIFGDRTLPDEPRNRWERAL